MRDEYKAHVTPDQWDAVKNLSIAKQIKIMKTMQPKAAAPKDQKADINTPLDSPPPVDHHIKTFLERQKEADFARNLRDLGSYSHLAQKLYEKKNS